MKKLIRLVFISLIGISLFAVSSCNEIDDQDLLTGRWVVAEIQGNELIEDCVRQSFVEFSDYVLDLRQRVVSHYDDCEEVKTIIGNYTVEGSTLIIRDTMAVIRQYQIEYVGPDSMSYSEPNMMTGGRNYYNYLRIKY